MVEMISMASFPSSMPKSLQINFRSIGLKRFNAEISYLNTLKKIGRIKDFVITCIPLDDVFTFRASFHPVPESITINGDLFEVGEVKGW